MHFSNVQSPGSNISQTLRASYSSLFSSSSSVPRNFLKMLLRLVRSSSFSGAKLPLVINPWRRLNSFSAQPSFLLAFSKDLT
jgi:hypothetical protein